MSNTQGLPSSASRVDFLTHDPVARLYTQRANTEIKVIPDFMGTVLRCETNHIEAVTVTFDTEDADGFRATTPLVMTFFTDTPIALGDIFAGGFATSSEVTDGNYVTWYNANINDIPRIAKVKIRSIVHSTAGTNPFATIKVFQGLTRPVTGATSVPWTNSIELAEAANPNTPRSMFPITNGDIPANYPYEWLVEGREFGLNATNSGRFVVVHEADALTLPATLNSTADGGFFTIPDASGRIVVEFTTTSTSGSIGVRIDDVVADEIVLGNPDNIAPGAVTTRTAVYDREEGSYRITFINNHASAINGIKVRVLTHKI